jgi:hypothetical protein
MAFSRTSQSGKELLHLFDVENVRCPLTFARDADA